VLPPCWQFIDEASFAYHGGALIEDDDLVQRAVRLGSRALQAMPLTTGYVGVDLVLGPADDGCEDRVLEINPRLTTSYIGLRHRTQDNLAAAMIACQQGLTPRLSFTDRPVQFAADGRVWIGQRRSSHQLKSVDCVNETRRACG
jgi:predicted ATP-grasp superfamily ATP-dependent carboligase